MDTLCQRKMGGIIDGISLPPHIHSPGIAATFPAAARFFFAAKCTANLGTGLVPMLTLAMPQSLPPDERNCSASRRLRVMMADENPAVHHFAMAIASSRCFVFHEIKDRCKSFMLHNLHVIFSFGNAGFHIATAFKPFPFSTPPSTINLPPCFLHFSMHRQVQCRRHLYRSTAPHDCFHSSGLPMLHLPISIYQFFPELIIYIFVDDQPAGSGASLPRGTNGTKYRCLSGPYQGRHLC